MLLHVGTGTVALRDLSRLVRRHAQDTSDFGERTFGIDQRATVRIAKS